MEALFEKLNSEIFGIWFLIGAAFVFFMQAGFAMVETGFTRAKNAGNIIMKNLMDFCIGTPIFAVLGFSIMMSENYLFGVIGVPNLKIFTSWSDFPWSIFVFNLVFCATAATIVSGAMAERTNFISYCVYSAAISAFVYPIEAGWVWNSQGWLAKLGFLDFAGSAAIHSVGGVTALIGAIMLGPRIGKYVRDKSGKVTKVNAIPGHSIPLGALGCFILWFGWLQRRRRNRRSDACQDLRYDNACPCRGNGNLYDLYLDQERQARCFHVSERISCGSCRHYCRM